MIPGNYQSLLNSVNFHNPSWSAFIFFFWAIAAVIYSFSSGRGRILSILIAVYMAELLVIQAPFLSTVVDAKFGFGLYLARLITFLVLFAIFFLVLSKYVFRTSLETRRISSWFFSLLFAILQVGFLISVILSFLPPDIKAGFAPLVTFVFLSNTAEFIWLLLPIAFLFLIGRFVSDHNRVE